MSKQQKAKTTYAKRRLMGQNATAMVHQNKKRKPNGLEDGGTISVSRFQLEELMLSLATMSGIVFDDYDRENKISYEEMKIGENPLQTMINVADSISSSIIRQKVYENQIVFPLPNDLNVQTPESLNTSYESIPEFFTDDTMKKIIETME